MNFAALDISLLGPAFLAGLVVLLSHVPLGRQVLDRGIIFIDLAIAQIAGLGVILAEVLWHTHHGWEVQLCAMSAALLGAWALHWLGKRWPKEQEAMIGVVFVLAATAAILLLHSNPHGGEHLKELLAGQILWVSWQQVAVAALVTAALGPLWYVLNRWDRHLAFYTTFAVAVTVSVQLVGVYLVFASLIVPALAMKPLQTKKAHIVGFLIGLSAYAAGLSLSALMDWPTSPVIVWVLALIAVLVASIGFSKN